MASTTKSDSSVTLWVEDVKNGHEEGIAKIWSRYFEELGAIATAKLHPRVRRVADAEDVTLSAFQSFFTAASNGRFPQLFDRNDLWKVLATITIRKAFDYNAAQFRQKRGGDKACSETTDLFVHLVGSEPTPSTAAQTKEDMTVLLTCLGDDRLQKIAVLKMKGYTDQEVAAKLKVTRRTVARKLKLIRDIWKTKCPQQTG